MYLVIYLALLFLIIKENDLKENLDINKKVFPIIVITLGIIAGFRYYVGTDYGTYLEIFNGINTINDYSYIEFGFRILILFIKMFTNSAVALFVLMSVLSMLFLYYGIKKLTDKTILSIFIFYGIFYIGYIFNAVRQGFAMCVFLYSIQYFEEKNIVKILICTVIATLIHSSGIYIPIAYIAYNIKLKDKYYIYILICGLILLLFNPLKQILMHINILGIGEKVRTYMSINSNDKLGIVSIVQRLVLISLMLMSLRLMKEKDKKIFNIYILGWIAYTVFSFQGTISTRINMFFRILEIILLPNIIESITNEKYKKYMYLFIILWISVILIVDLRNPANFPYKIVGV